jgi:hypothetical protein
MLTVDSGVDRINEIFSNGQIFHVTDSINLALGYAFSTAEAIEKTFQTINDAIIQGKFFRDDWEADIDEKFYEYRRWRFEAIDDFTKIVDNILSYQELSALVSQSREKIASICDQEKTHSISQEEELSIIVSRGISEAIDDFEQEIDNISSLQKWSTLDSASTEKINEVRDIIDSLRSRAKNQNEQDTSQEAERSAQNGND